ASLAPRAPRHPVARARRRRPKRRRDSAKARECGRAHRRQADGGVKRWNAPRGDLRAARLPPPLRDPTASRLRGAGEGGRRHAARMERDRLAAIELPLRWVPLDGTLPGAYPFTKEP